MSDTPQSQISETLRDGAYAVVGLGVLGFQRAQVRRHELTEQLRVIEGQIRQLAQVIEERVNPAMPAIEAQLTILGQQLLELAKTFESQLQPAREEFERRVSELEERLPEPARSALVSVRNALNGPEAS
jgi:DNA anti-recombination protein RmuC